MKQETIIKLTGRIDSNNAREWEQKIMGQIALETIPALNSNCLLYLGHKSILS